jgi:chemotaxis protein CheZ
MAKNTANRVQNLRPRKTSVDSLDVDPLQVSQALESILSTMRGDLNAEHLALHQHVSELTQALRGLRDEIVKLEPSKIWQEHIPVASDELDAIVQATEDATNRIMSAAEIVERVAGELDGDRSTELTDVVTAIYEACSFQDITGQRVKKVVRTLQHIEGVVGAMVSRFGLGNEGVPSKVEPEPELADPDAKLLHGPSLPSDAKSQADIDALFAS